MHFRIQDASFDMRMCWWPQLNVSNLAHNITQHIILYYQYTIQYVPMDLQFLCDAVCLNHFSCISFINYLNYPTQANVDDDAVLSRMVDRQKKRQIDPVLRLQMLTVYLNFAW